MLIPCHIPTLCWYHILTLCWLYCDAMLISRHILTYADITSYFDVSDWHDFDITSYSDVMLISHCDVMLISRHIPTLCWYCDVMLISRHILTLCWYHIIFWHDVDVTDYSWCWYHVRYRWQPYLSCIYTHPYASVHDSATAMKQMTARKAANSFTLDITRLIINGL